MAKPDLDDGYLRIAHELFAALACAGFNKWEWIVLREVFDQIYGPKKASVATLSPTGIAARVGTYKESIVRAIRTLCGSGVLSKTAEGEYRFIKDYEGWRDGEKRRCSPSELAYCAASKRIKASKINGNNGAPTHKRNAGTTALPAGNNGAPRREQIGSPPGTAALPHGNNGAPVNGVPPRPPIGERARSGEEEKKEKKGENAPPPPLQPSPIPDDPVSRQCIQLAMDRWGASNGDYVIGDMLRTFPPKVVRYAIDRCFDKHGADLRPSYLRTICQEVDAKGIPKKPGEDRGRTAVQQRPEETRTSVPATDFDQYPDTPEFREFRAMHNGRAS